MDKQYVVGSSQGNSFDSTMEQAKRLTVPSGMRHGRGGCHSPVGSMQTQNTLYQGIYYHIYIYFFFFSHKYTYVSFRPSLFCVRVTFPAPTVNVQQ